MRDDAPSHDGPWRLAGDRRRSGRVRQDNLGCSIGRVTDLSSEGMRVVCDIAPEGEVDVIFTYRGTDLVICAQPVWSRPHEPGEWEVGLRFLRADRMLLQRLWSLSLDVQLRERGSDGES
jgi:hypothetical protein